MLPSFMRRHALITGDHGLVKVWCGLRPTGRPATQGPVAFEFEPDPALFPRLPDLGHAGPP